MAFKARIPSLSTEEIERILYLSFPKLEGLKHSIKFHPFDGGIINLVYCVEIEGENLGDIPKKVVLKVIFYYYLIFYQVLYLFGIFCKLHLLQKNRWHFKFAKISKNTR